MKLTFIEKISFGFGGGVNAVKTDFFVWYLGVYYLAVVGLNPLYTGTALLIALIFDAFSDPLIGAFSDRIKSKFGRRHSLMLLSLAPITLSYYLLFIPPDLILDHQFNAFLWLTIFSILTRFFVSLFEIPHKALAVEIPKSYEDKASIMSLREGFQSLIALSHSFLILPLIGFQNDMSDWSAVGQVGAALMFVFGLISILGTLSLLPKLPKWEGNENSVLKDKVSQLKVEFGYVLLNKPLRIFLLGSISIQIAWGLANSLTFLTQTQFWDLTPLQIRNFIAIYFLTAAFSWFLTPKLVKSFDKKRLVIVCLLLMGVFHSAPYALYKIGLAPAAGSNEIIQFLSIFLFLTGIFSIMSLMVRESMIPDVVDEIHASTGLRQDGTISALTSFCAKCMTGFGQFFSMLILWIIGYPSEESATLMQREYLAIAHGPLVFLMFVIPIILFMQYPISRSKHRQIIGKLNQQKL